MRTVGIICECNPFHSGHAYLIEAARRDGADVVVCAMSGCFVQRGEPAIVDAHVRAQALVRGGADLVVELPFPFSSAGAEFFAATGVKILDRLGVDELWFGSECGDIERLHRFSEVCDDPALVEQYRVSAETGKGTARAYFECLREAVGEDMECLSNDILAIAYLRALRSIGSSMKPVTRKRIGSSYRDSDLGAGDYPSATALRRKWREEGLGAVLPYLPAQTHSAYVGADPSDLKHAERLILGHIRLSAPDDLECCAALGGGLGRRFWRAAQSACTWEELLSSVSTKQYPTARLQRGILFALMQIADADLRLDPAYTRLLGANRKGCAYLSAQRKNARIAVVTRRADLPRTPQAARQEEWERRAYAFYTLCKKECDSAHMLWKHGAYIQT